MKIINASNISIVALAFTAALIATPSTATETAPLESQTSSGNQTNLDVKNNAENGPMKSGKKRSSRSKRVTGQTKKKGAGTVRQRDNTGSDKNIGDPPASSVPRN
jgi:hypothetical protein